MTKVYCNKCGAEIPYPDSDELREEIRQADIFRIASECKYEVGIPCRINGLKAYPRGTEKYLDETRYDLCIDCQIKLYKLVGEFMDGTPVSTPA